MLLAAAVFANNGAPEPLMEAGHWKRVRSIAQSRYTANPNDPYALYLLARVKFEYDDLEGAQPLIEKAVQLAPQNAEYRFLLSAVYGRKAESANIFSKWSLAGKFKEQAEKAIQLDPKHIEARHALIQFHLQAPGIAGGDKKKAYELAEEVLRINAARGYLEKAGIARREKQFDQIEPLYRKAVEADPRSYAARMALANFCASDRQKKYAEAEQHAREALKIEAARVGAYSLLAGLYAFQQRWAELDAIIAQSEKNLPDNLYPLYNAGRTLAESGKDAARAERYLRKYLTQEPEPDFPPHAAAHWRLGQALEKQGRTEEAIREYERAVQLDPKLEGARKDLKRLKK
jgi:tetratricopeptide (TPR) repeat protein